MSAALIMYALSAAFCYQMLPLIYPIMFNWPEKMPPGALPKRILLSLAWPGLLFMGWLGTIVILIQRSRSK